MIPPREDSEAKADGQDAKEDEKVDGYKTNKEDLAVLVSWSLNGMRASCKGGGANRLLLPSPHSWPTWTSRRQRHLKLCDDTRATFRPRSRTCAARNLYRHDQLSARDETGPRMYMARVTHQLATTNVLHIRTLYCHLSLPFACGASRCTRAYSVATTRSTNRKHGAYPTRSNGQFERPFHAQPLAPERTHVDRLRAEQGHSLVPDGLFSSCAQDADDPSRGPARGGAPYPYS